MNRNAMVIGHIPAKTRRAAQFPADTFLRLVPGDLGVAPRIGGIHRKENPPMATTKQLQAAMANLEKAHRAQHAAAKPAITHVPRQRRTSAAPSTSASSQRAAPRGTSAASRTSAGGRSLAASQSAKPSRSSGRAKTPQVRASGGRSVAASHHTPSASTSSRDFSHKSRAELYEIAKQRHLPGRSSMGRAELASKLSAG